MKENENNELKFALWDIANILRGKMDPDEFKNYMLGFIFFKQLSFVLEKEITVENEVELDEIETYSDADKLEFKKIIIEGPGNERVVGGGIGFYFNPKNTFNEIIKKINNGEKDSVVNCLRLAFNEISDSTIGYESNEDFIGLFSDINLNNPKLGSDDREINNTISKILLKIDKVEWNDQNDVLGDAYEYLISNFASTAGKRGGEFYTPSEVSKVLAKIISSHDKKITSIYDPTCGSGSLLIKAYNELTQKYSKSDISNIGIYGQELNHTTYNLARMNMFLHNVGYNSFKIRQGDTLFNDKFKEEYFSAIVANPPFGTKWEGTDELLKDERFGQYGAIAPNSRAEFAFVQHMLHHLENDGIMATVLPNGVLFRGGKEKDIRKFIIEKGWIDSIIALPDNLFFGTSIPAIIMVFKKCRKESDPILFIDAQLCFEKYKTKNFLTEKTYEKIVEIFNERKEVDEFLKLENGNNKRIVSRFIAKDKIVEESYNLNVSRYINISSNVIQRDIESINDDIFELDEKIKELKTPISNLLKDLNLK